MRLPKARNGRAKNYMSDKVFIDTNILIYANDGTYPEKQQKSRDRIRDIYKMGNGVLSAQVLHEFYVASIRKLNLAPVDVRKQIESLLDFEIINIDVSLIKEAIDCSILDKISYWEALIVVAAQKGGCSELWTQDLNHGQIIKGVRVVNIFNL